MVQKGMNTSAMSSETKRQTPNDVFPEVGGGDAQILLLNQSGGNISMDKDIGTDSVSSDSRNSSINVKSLDSTFSPIAISSTKVSPQNQNRQSRITPNTTVSNSASSSFDERFKFKISIYSKVSGCRMTNLPDYTIVKQLRVVVLEHITFGNPHETLNVKFAYEKMKNGGLQVITDDKRLSDALSGLSYFAGIPCKMTFPNSPRVVGFVKDLPINMEPADLKREIRKTIPEVYSVRYITEKMAGYRPVQHPCAFISFNLRYLPGYVRVYGKEYEVLVPNPMQCTRCCRYGHQGKQCRAEIRCPICGRQHSKLRCFSNTYRCVNCKGNHASTSHSCEIWQQGKLMNELRYRGGLTAEEAIDVASQGKIQHKKHYFISPDEYFANQESYYLDNGSGDTSGTGSTDTDDPMSTQTSSYISNSRESSTGSQGAKDAKTVSFHEKFIATQQFLDLMTDLYLKLTNPNEKYTSSMLMPGFDDDSTYQRMNIGSKRPSKVAQQFKLSVLKAFERDNSLNKQSSQDALDLSD